MPNPVLLNKTGPTGAGPGGNYISQNKNFEICENLIREEMVKGAKAGRALEPKCLCKSA
jgi:hypothetical protein